MTGDISDVVQMLNRHTRNQTIRCLVQRRLMEIGRSTVVNMKDKGICRYMRMILAIASTIA
jgi:hypothetical protein